MASVLDGQNHSPFRREGVHPSDPAGHFHYEASQDVDNRWFHGPGLAAKEDCLACNALEEVALGFGRDASAREHA